MAVNTLMKLVLLVLNKNCFTFENKYCQQICGCAMGSPLTLSLANIYMYEWQQSLIEYQIVRNELYGRYVISILMSICLI